MKTKTTFLAGLGLRAMFLLLLGALSAQAQERTYEPVFSVGGGYTSGTYTPFWLRANQFGEVPTWESYWNAGMSANSAFNESHTARTESTVAIKN